MSIKNKLSKQEKDNYLEQIRTRLGLTQKEVCEILKISQQTYSDWKTLKNHPRIPANRIQHFEFFLSEAGLTIQDIPPSYFDDIYNFQLTRIRNSDSIK